MIIKKYTNYLFPYGEKYCDDVHIIFTNKSGMAVTDSLKKLKEKRNEDFTYYSAIIKSKKEQDFIIPFYVKNILFVPVCNRIADKINENSFNKMWDYIVPYLNKNKKYIINVNDFTQNLKYIITKHKNDDLKLEFIIGD